MSQCSFHNSDRQYANATFSARNLHSFESIVMENFDSQERLFFGALDNELERIVAFYEARESDMAKRYEMLARQLREVRKK